jgi:hypothetical protein
VLSWVLNAVGLIAVAFAIASTVVSQAVITGSISEAGVLGLGGERVDSLLVCLLSDLSEGAVSVCCLSHEVSVVLFRRRYEN